MRKIDTNNKYLLKAAMIRQHILKMHAASEASHIGSSFSCVDILVALYFKILRIYVNDSHNPKRDRFILSKGHAASALYATLALRGFFSQDKLMSYCQDGGCLWGHATINSVPGIEASTGSLGHGLPIGAGMALSTKNARRKFRVFVLMGDGECNEGSVWEAAMFARQHNLDNLIAIIDYNKIQAFGRTKDVIDLEPFKEKWRSFGWGVKEVDGHNINRMIDILSGVPFSKGRPSVLIAHTIKGKGISFMENQLAWHYRSPDEFHLAQGLKELRRKLPR